MSKTTAEDPREPALQVRRYLQGSVAGSLATISARDELAGYPFGSLVPYALDEGGAPLVMISELAQHTRNLRASPRASLLVADPNAEGDPQVSWRVTLVGEFHPVAVEDAAAGEALGARYRARNPTARAYQQLKDFAYWRLDIQAIRSIQGFGRIAWVSPEDYRACVEPEALAEAAPGAIAHMNADHGDALLDYCRAFRGLDPGAAELLSLDAGGFLVRTRDPDGLEFFPFDEPVRPAQLRHAFVDLVKRARATLVLDPEEA